MKEDNKIYYTGFAVGLFWGIVIGLVSGMAIVELLYVK